MLIINVLHNFGELLISNFAGVHKNEKNVNMENIQAKYISFKYRFFISSDLYFGMIMFLVLETLILFKPGLPINHAFIYQILLLFLLSLFLNICYIKSKYYIDKIEINDQSVVLTVYLFDNKLDRIEIPFSDLLVDLKSNLYERYPKYALEFKLRSTQTKLLTGSTIKQYEIGYWNKKNLKSAYRLITNTQITENDLDQVNLSHGIGF